MSLPGELVDSVVDLLGSDRPALKVTSLLSRQWLPRSRHYLFSSIWLSAWKDADLKRVEAFFTLVSSPIATFIPAVAEVYLRIWERADREYPARAILVTLETHGIRPTELVLDCCSHLRDVLSTPPAFTSSLVHLELNLGEEDCNLLGGICSFPLLETLIVHATQRNISDSMLPAFTVLPPRLHTLQASNAQVLRWILGLDDQVQRQIVNLGLWNLPSSRSQWFRVPQYVESLTFDHYVYSPYIFSLSIKKGHSSDILACWYSEGDDDCGPDLRNMRRLKYLYIRFTPLPLILELLGRILPQLQLSPARRTLESINLHFSCVDSYDAQSWISVDEMLSDVATYPCLRSIVISTKDAFKFPDNHLGTPARDCKLTFLHEHLRRCSDRGLLRVDIPIA
ncbi:hypothetical protein GGX14DRAFT_595820 [Mycena pura]|uniref:Uncharacterized protein n=1 Tax=Mycena pura TaxID=153505 RepID=A0AAD6UU10_9AGAR|nr:hypothetical protein GGX14DRAFT_595820 [Mycena pura]